MLASVAAVFITAGMLHSIALDVSGDRQWAEWAVHIARCESSLRVNAVGKAGETGLMQLHPIHEWVDHERSLVDPEYNIRMAWKLYNMQGRDAWSCETIRRKEVAERLYRQLSQASYATLAEGAPY